MQENGVDIVVATPTGHRTLVGEVKLKGSIEDATTQVRDYMRGIGAEVGLVVVGDKIRILRETYRGESSIRVIGDFPVHLAYGLVPARDPVDFVDRVQRWLESLGDQELRAGEPLRAALIEHVLPALAEGTVRATGPRTRRVAG